jgi:hypothetical protein
MMPIFAHTTREGIGAVLIILSTLLIGTFSGMALERHNCQNNCNNFILEQYAQNPVITNCIEEKTGIKATLPYPKLWNFSINFTNGED